VRIRVKAAHIVGGNRCLASSCAVALAVEESLPGSEPMVMLCADDEDAPAVVVVTRRGRPVEYELPAHVKAFIRRFDLGEMSPPFERHEIEFDLPVEHLLKPRAASA
jgi:hypothetical protein